MAMFGVPCPIRERIADTNPEELLPVMTSVPYGGEGFDASFIDTVFLVGPISYPGLLVQAAGRALRMLIDGVNYLPDAHAAGRLDEALTEPDGTGDPRWDALLAGAIRYRLHQSGLSAPGWTCKKPLDRFWWPTAAWDVQAYNDMAHSPAELSRIGIFLDERAFTAA